MTCVGIIFFQPVITNVSLNPERWNKVDDAKVISMSFQHISKCLSNMVGNTFVRVRVRVRVCVRWRDEHGRAPAKLLTPEVLWPQVLESSFQRF